MILGVIIGHLISVSPFTSWFKCHHWSHDIKCHHWSLVSGGIIYQWIQVSSLVTWYQVSWSLITCFRWYHLPVDSSVIIGHMILGVIIGHLISDVIIGHLISGVTISHLISGVTIGHLIWGVTIGHLISGIIIGYLISCVIIGHLISGVIIGHLISGVIGYLIQVSSLVTLIIAQQNLARKFSYCLFFSHPHPPRILLRHTSLFQSYLFITLMLHCLQDSVKLKKCWMMSQELEPSLRLTYKQCYGPSMNRRSTLCWETCIMTGMGLFTVQDQNKGITQADNNSCRAVVGGDCKDSMI